MKLDQATIEAAYAQYWDQVKHSVDEDGWVYPKELPFMLDTYFTANTGKEIDFETDINAGWKGAQRWRPKELSNHPTQETDSVTQPDPRGDRDTHRW